MPQRDFLLPTTHFSVESFCPDVPFIRGGNLGVLAILLPSEQVQAVGGYTPRLGGAHDNGAPVSFILSSWGRDVHVSMTWVTTCLQLTNHLITQFKMQFNWQPKPRTKKNKRKRKRSEGKNNSCIKLITERKMCGKKIHPHKSPHKNFGMLFYKLEEEGKPQVLHLVKREVWFVYLP